MTAVRERSSARGPGGLSLLARVVLVAALILLLLPYLMAPVYRVINPVSTLMLARWLTGRNVVRTYVPIDRLAPTLPLSVLVAEDDRFCRHYRIAAQEIRGALPGAPDITAAPCRPPLT